MQRNKKRQFEDDPSQDKNDFIFQEGENNDSFYFQKDIKEIQGKLFIQGPDYLKGNGFQGEADNELYRDSIEGSYVLNSMNVLNGKEFKTLNNEDIFILQQNNKFNIHGNEEVQSGDRSYNYKTQEVSQNYHIQNVKMLSQQDKVQNDPERYQREMNEEQKNHNSLKTQSKVSNNQSMKQDRTKWLLYKLGDKQSQSQKYQPSSLKLNSSYLSPQNISPFIEDGSNKLDDQLINVELAQNTKRKVYDNSQSRKEKVKSLVIEFFGKLQNLSKQRKDSKLKPSDYTLINDLSYFKAKRYNFKLIQIFISKYTSIVQKLKIFQPTDTILLVWNIISTIVTYLFCYMYSILLFFDQHEVEGYVFNIFYQVAFWLFLVDILINFNSAYYNQDKIITSRKQIAKKYVMSYFLTDFASITVLFFQIAFSEVSLTYNPEHKWIIYARNFLVFLKILGISDKKNRIKDIIIFNDTSKHIIKIVYLVIFTFTAVHIMSIFWHSIALLETNYDFNETWMKKLNIDNSSYYTRYIYSIYWQILTLFAIGYGDIVPTNEYEYLFSSFTIIFFSFIFAHLFYTIGMILQEIEMKSRIMRDEISTFQRFLDGKCVKIELKYRVRNYLKFLASEQKDRNKEKEDQIFSKLSNELRDEVTTEINTSIIDRKKTRQEMVFIMKEVLISPNETIFQDKEMDDQSIYFIQGGCIEIYQNKINKLQQSHLRIKLLHCNDIFGELSFFSGSSRTASARSLNLSTLYKIKRNDFIDLIKKNQEDFEKFQMIQDKILYFKDLSCIDLRCYICQKENHISINCPKIHQNFDKQFLALKYSYSIDQIRKQFQRKLRILLQPLQHLYMIQINLINTQDQINSKNLKIKLLFLSYYKNLIQIIQIILQQQYIYKLNLKRDVVQRNQMYLDKLKENIEKLGSQAQIMLQDEENDNNDKHFTNQSESRYYNVKSQYDDDDEKSITMMSQIIKNNKTQTFTKNVSQINSNNQSKIAALLFISKMILTKNQYIQQLYHMAQEQNQIKYMQQNIKIEYTDLQFLKFLIQLYKIMYLLLIFCNIIVIFKLQINFQMSIKNFVLIQQNTPLYNIQIRVVTKHQIQQKFLSYNFAYKNLWYMRQSI